MENCYRGVLPLCAISKGELSVRKDSSKICEKGVCRSMVCHYVVQVFGILEHRLRCSSKCGLILGGPCSIAVSDARVPRCLCTTKHTCRAFNQT